MGINDIQKYREREVMTALLFLQLWTEELPNDEPYEVAAFLAQLVGNDRYCIHTPGLPDKLDVWDENQYATRTRLQADAVRTLKAIASERGHIDAAESILLRREAIVEGFEAQNTTGPRFLYPPVLQNPAPHHLGTATAGTTNGTKKELEHRCQHSDDYRSVIWFGTRYDFNPTQARVVEMLWREYEKGGLGRSESRIGEDLDSRANNFQLRGVFRSAGEKHLAWDTMICRVAKGIYALKPPDDPPATE